MSEFDDVAASIDDDAHGTHRWMDGWIEYKVDEGKNSRSAIPQVRWRASRNKVGARPPARLTN